MTIRRPLDGMLVLDLGQIYNGPYCGLQLGFMGARVLKIEPPEGDVVRRRKREVEPYPLVMLNSNKESVVLDLKQPRGKEIFLELVAKADVLIENFAAGVMDRLGIGWDVLQQAQSAPGLWRQLGLRARRSLSRSRRHGRHHPGDERHHQRDRRCRRAADQGGRRGLRLPRRHPSLRRHPGRAGAARAHRPGPAGRGRHARGGGDRARLGAGRGDGRRHQRARPHRQPASRARHGALQHLPLQRRLCRDLHRGRAALAFDVPDAGAARPARATRTIEHASAAPSTWRRSTTSSAPGRSRAPRTRC